MKMWVLSLRKLISKIIYVMFEIASATILSGKQLQEVKLKTNKQFYFLFRCFILCPSQLCKVVLSPISGTSKLVCNSFAWLSTWRHHFVLFFLLFPLLHLFFWRKRIMFLFFFWFKIIFLHYSFTIFLLSCFYPVQQFLWIFFFIFPIWRISSRWFWKVFLLFNQQTSQETS